MKEPITREEILHQIDYAIESIPQTKIVFTKIDIPESISSKIDKVQESLLFAKRLIIENILDEKYLQQIANDILQLCSKVYIKADADISHWERLDMQRTWRQIIKNDTQIDSLIDKINVSLSLFEKIGDFANNVVIIGANGSGKSSISTIFKSQLNKNSLSISAQRILNIKQIESVKNNSNTKKKLEEYQSRDKTNKNNDYSYLSDEYSVVLDNLISENVSANGEYKVQAIEEVKQGKAISNPPITRLEMALSIWNSLIEHRQLVCPDGVNIKAKTLSGDLYETIKMSDGEKVMLFLIAQVLQAPLNGLIIIDEPEIYLHKAIVKKLWDRLEKVREDCVFIYLTHDIEFASSRINSKKVWIKSSVPPSQWDFELLPKEELPENLLMEILGSRKKILFCEGEKGSLDEQIFNTLFPELTIMPVGSCSNVISYTKAFNKLKNTHSTALGLIDSDFHTPEELKKLKTESIHTYNVAEIENLFLDQDFLILLAAQLIKETTVIENLKTQILAKFQADKSIQIAHYISAYITYLYNTSHLKRGNTIDEVNKNLSDFNTSIRIAEWQKEREEIIDAIIAAQDYPQVILLYNNKGLKSIANGCLKIMDFTERSMSFLLKNDEAKTILKKYFPSEIQ